MSCLYILSSSPAVLSVLAEQIADVQLFSTVQEALTAFRAVPTDKKPQGFWVDETLLDAESQTLFASLTKEEGVPPLLFVLGTTVPLEGLTVTERFAKPARMGYVTARIQFYRKAREKNAVHVFSLRQFHFLPHLRELQPKDGGEAVKLTEKESGLLEYLCRAEDMVPRHVLLEEVWGYDAEIDTHTIETHIYRLRRKLAVDISENDEDAFIVDLGCYGLNPAWGQR